MEAAVGKFQRFLDELPHPLAQNERFVLEIEKYTRVITVKKGDYLLRSGEICQNAYFINKGVFINQYIGEQGNVCVTGFSSDNQYPFLSAIGYFTQAPSDFEIKAIENGELLGLSRAHIEELSFKYPMFASYYQNIMLTIISKFYLMFAVLQSSSTEDFIKYLYKNYHWIIARVPDKYIAQYMGISDSWYCKLKKRILV